MVKVLDTVNAIHQRKTHLQNASNCASKSLLDKFDDSPTSFDVL